MKKETILMLSAACLLLCCSCARSDYPFDVPVEKERAFFFGITNVRELFKDSLVAHAYFDKDKYKVFTLGTSDAPYSGIPKVFIELHDGTVIDLTKPDVTSVLIQKATARAPWKSNVWKEGTERLYFHPFEFFIKDNQLLGMRVTYDPEAYDYSVSEDGTKRKFPRYSISAPKLGTSKENLHAIPFDAREFLEVFGQPDRVVDSFTE
ncbi:MAG: hypothetical protein R6V03_09780 [Kiritimatiellia bacterium]